MLTIQEHIDDFLHEHTSSATRDALALRKAWEIVAGEKISSVTGAVFYDKKNPNIIVIYTISSLHKAELEADKEIYRLMLTRKLRLADEDPIEDVKFAVSQNKAMRKAVPKDRVLEKANKVQTVPLSAQEKEKAWESLSGIENEELKMSLYKATISNVEWKKGREVSNTSQKRF